MIHIHINENLRNLLNHFPAFSFFKSHNFFSQVGPDNKITHERCSKAPNIIQNHILVLDLTIPKIVWSVHAFTDMSTSRTLVKLPRRLFLLQIVTYLRVSPNSSDQVSITSANRDFQ